MDGWIPTETTYTWLLCFPSSAAAAAGAGCCVQIHVAPSSCVCVVCIRSIMHTLV
jgi:hypothetical protein